VSNVVGVGVWVMVGSLEQETPQCSTGHAAAPPPIGRLSV
jgi:hypothetical protein